MNVDLSLARATMESTFTDQCRITRDVGGVHDDVLDPVTLRLTRPANDAITIYTGSCSVAPEQRVTTEPAVEGGDQRALIRYVVKIPVAAPLVEPGDLVHMTVADDPALVDQLLRVVSIEQRTRAVSRRVQCELRQRVTDRP